jgi:hypothetical protein
MYICISNNANNIKINIMTARASHTGKVIVKGDKMLKGVGIQFRGIASDGQFSFLMTETAYSKIAHKCKFN